MLLLHRYFVRLASAAVAAFLWVLIFEYFTLFTTPVHALISTALLYALCQVTTILLTPLALMRLRGGMRSGLAYGTLLLCAALSLLGMLLLGLFSDGIVIIALLLGAYPAFYRVPYSTQYAALVPSGIPWLAMEILLAAVPLVAGVFLMQGGETAQLFFASGGVCFLALLLLAFVPNVHEAFTWGYYETFAHLIARENRCALLISVGRGISGAALFLVWPLVLLFVFAGSPLGIGATFSATLLVILLFRTSHRRVLVEDHAEAGAFLDEYTALKEMGMGVGRLALCFSIVVALLLFQ
ncbi:MAG TPA: hypothetical protein VJG64_01100 [Candidatus Paceibacterota bacterium]